MTALIQAQTTRVRAKRGFGIVIIRIFSNIPSRLALPEPYVYRRESRWGAWTRVAYVTGMSQGAPAPGPIATRVRAAAPATLPCAFSPPRGDGISRHGR